MTEQAKVLSPDAWLAEGANSGITTEQLDDLARQYQAADQKYQAAKKVASELYEHVTEIEGKLVEALEQAGKRKYFAEGVGTLYFRDQMVVTTPKTIEDKKNLFSWVRKKFGETFYLDKVSINHQTLQKLYNDSFEEAKEAGEDVSTFHIPGLQQPTNRRTLCLKKENE